MAPADDVGPPTDDKPGVTLAPPADPDRRDNLFTIRVDDCVAVYEELRRRGAEFLTPPVTSGAETRAFFRDPDGHLFEISEYQGDARATDARDPADARLGGPPPAGRPRPS